MDRGFDAHAREYGARWEQDPVAAALRRAVHRVLDEVVPAGARLLDVGCGPGEDAARLGARGVSVVGIDPSRGMVAEARRRGVDARVLPAEAVGTLADAGPFDAVLMDFGVANCVDLDAVAEGLARVLRPGGVGVVVPMPRIHPTWMLRELVRGRPAGALARARAEAIVDVAGEPIPFRYRSPAEVAAAFSTGFDVVGQRGLGGLLPPPGGRTPPGLVRALDALERPLRGLPGIRSVGDHVIVVLRRRGGPRDRPERVRGRLRAAASRRLGAVDPLRALVLEVTKGCQSACIGCDHRGPAGGELLTVDRAVGLAREAGARGCAEVVVTGGEPLLRPDLDALLTRLRGVGPALTLLTNGLALGRHAALVARTCDRVVVSLDGHDRATYRAARGVDGLDAVRAGIAALRARAPRLPISARVTVTAANAASLDAIAALAKALALDGVSFLAADVASAQAFARAAPSDLAPPDGTVVAASLARAVAAHGAFVRDSEDALRRVVAASGRAETLRAPACDAPWTSVFVQADLSTRPCFFQPAYADAGQGLDAALRAGRRALRRLDVARDPICARCVCWARLAG